MGLDHSGKDYGDYTIDAGIYLSAHSHFVAIEDTLGKIRIVAVSNANHGTAQSARGGQLLGCAPSYQDAGSELNDGFAGWNPDEQEVALIRHVCPSSSDFPFRWTEGTLNILNLSSWHVRSVIRGVVAAAWSPDGKMIASLIKSADAGLAAQLFDARTLAPISVTPLSQSADREDKNYDYRLLLSWSHDGRQLLVANHAGKVWIISPRNPQPLLVAEGTPGTPLWLWASQSIAICSRVIEGLDNLYPIYIANLLR